MWPFRRRRDAEVAPQVSSTPDGDAGAPAQQAAPPPRPDGWRRVPPIQRTIGDPPHTYRTDDIGEILSSWDSPRLSGELGHQVSPEAPAGVLHGMTTVVATAPPPATLPTSLETGVLRELPHDHDADQRAGQGVGHEAHHDGGTASVSTPDAGQATHRPIGDAPLRTLAASTGPMPSVSRIAAPDVVAPRPLPALPLQRAVDTASPAAPAAAPSGPTPPAADPVPTPPSPAEPATTAGDAPPDKQDVPTNPLVAPVAPVEPEMPTAAGPTGPPGTVVEPPIQPRAIQRRAVDMPLPPVSRPADGAHDAGTAPSAVSPASADPTEATSPPPAPSAEAPSDAGPTPSAPAGVDAVDAGGADWGPSAPGSTASAPLAGEHPPLVQRTPEAGHGDAAHSHDDGGDHGDETAQTGPAMPLQRQQAASQAPEAPEEPPTVRPVGLGGPLVEPPTPPTISGAAETVEPSEPASPFAPPAEAGATSSPSLPLAGTPSVQRNPDSGEADGLAPPDSDPDSSPAAPLTGDWHPTTTRPSTTHPSSTHVTPASPSTADQAPRTADDATATAAGTARAPELPTVAPALALHAPIPARAAVTVSTLRDTTLVLQRSLDEGPPTVLGEPSSPLPTPAPATHAPSSLPTGPGGAASAGPTLQRTTLSPASVPGRPPTTVLSGAPAVPATSPSMTLASPRPEVVSPSWPNAGDIAVGNGVAQRMPDGSVQFTVQREGGSVRDRVSAWEGLAGSTMGSAMQNTGLGAAPTTPGAPAEPGGPGITATASPAPEAPAAEGNERETLEEQAKKLWPHIRRKLTNELLSRPEGRRPSW